jgi:hypothetical protein
LVLAFANGKTIETEAGTLTQPHRGCKNYYLISIATRSVVMNLAGLSRPGTQQVDLASRSDAMNENSGLISVVAPRRIVWLPATPALKGRPKFISTLRVDFQL